ncbi:MAG TPA: hypothetical protein VF796_01450 [Humisphaera sp.]
MPQVTPLEPAALRVAALVCAAFAVVSLAILSPDAWRAAVALGVLAAVFGSIGLRRKPSLADRLLLVGAAAFGIAAALAAALAHL